MQNVSLKQNKPCTPGKTKPRLLLLDKHLINSYKTFCRALTAGHFWCFKAEGRGIDMCGTKEEEAWAESETERRQTGSKGEETASEK